MICSSAFAQNLFVSGTDARGGEIYKFSWDGRQSIFASGLADPGDLAFDSVGNLFVVDYEIVGDDPGSPLLGNAAVARGFGWMFAGRAVPARRALQRLVGGKS